MSHDADYLLALRLQSELDALEENETNEIAELPVLKTNNKRKNNQDDLNATQNLVHPDWETIDPTPDIYSLFGTFDIRFFQRKLQCVELEWSKRMYQCAGICYQRRNRMGMSITIRLSEPLLKLRSRRDLIETMLHEMIHAYLFIQNVREGNGGHGPNFKRIMENINKVAGTRISVYHSFHDEVEVYKTHIWRCNGICQHRTPFYGWVKRTSNRAPGPNDNWWAKHHETCSGTFVKVSQPEPKRKAKKAKIAETNTPKITSWVNSPKSNSNTPRAIPKNTSRAGGSTKMNGGGTIVLKPTTKNRVVTISDDDGTNNGSVLSNVFDASAGGSLRNVVGFRDLNGSNDTPANQRQIFSSGGHVLGSSSNKPSNENPSENIRNIWANKFNNPRPAAEISPIIEIIEINDNNNNQSPDIEWVIPKESRIKKETKPHKSYYNELLDDLGEDGANIIMIDDEFDDTVIENVDQVTDTTVIDELFGRDTLMADFNNINNVVMNDPENLGNPNMEIVMCPICEDRMARDELSSHLDGCNGITVKVNPKQRGAKKKPLPFYKNKAKPSTSRTVVSSADQELLRRAGYTQDAIDRMNDDVKEAQDYNDRIMNEIATDRRRKFTTGARARDLENGVLETIPFDGAGSLAHTNTGADLVEIVTEKHICPICNAEIDADLINQHLDDCLGL